MHLEYTNVSCYFIPAERLDVSENSLTGTIPTQFGLLTSLSKSTMSFEGSMLSELGLTLFFSIGRISLKRNAGIGGTLPTEIGNMSSMSTFRPSLVLVFASYRFSSISPLSFV